MRAILNVHADSPPLLWRESRDILKATSRRFTNWLAYEDRKEIGCKTLRQGRSGGVGVKIPLEFITCAKGIHCFRIFCLLICRLKANTTE